MRELLLHAEIAGLRAELGCMARQKDEMAAQMRELRGDNARLEVQFIDSQGENDLLQSQLQQCQRGAKTEVAKLQAMVLSLQGSKDQQGSSGSITQGVQVSAVPSAPQPSSGALPPLPEDSAVLLPAPSTQLGIKIPHRRLSRRMRSRLLEAKLAGMTAKLACMEQQQAELVAQLQECQAEQQQSQAAKLGLEEQLRQCQRTVVELEAMVLSLQAGQPPAASSRDRSHETDVVIIGSGIGGLCCAALLARYGYSVTVLESHYLAGGAAHSFEIQGYSCDAGPSFFAGLSGPPGSSKTNPLKLVLDAVGESVECVTYKKWIVYQPNGRSFECVCDADAYAENIRREGGEEAYRQWKELEQLMQPLQEGAAMLPAAALRADPSIALTAGPRLALVSKRWQRAVYAEPLLWQRFVVRNNQPGKLFMQPRLALLRRQAAHVACFSWQADGEAAGHSLPAFLAALQPSQLVQLELLLSAMLPPSASLRSLDLGAVNLAATNLTAAAFDGCTQLRQLTSLIICVAAFPASQWQRAFAAVLQQAARISHLSMQGYGEVACLGEMPTSLRGYRGLTSLALPVLCLNNLPCGAYLADLESLALTCNTLSALPSSLSAATRLTRRQLSYNTQLRLSLQDIARLLRLPRLLCLNAVEVQHDWRQQPAQH
ncbi:carotene isomerase [Chlorella sorokiniana]|uniref:Carotene isomerase n=1 Tax=Chlorella sorokiniana TaxID=3076 RepID=A0A2P6TK90_CHLSO|nr:carotene isomerase [Chlorella sorokiniana]|eukprot:PRW44458.1 carotene isomerase [Chlorella sorokiniana]